MKIVGVVVIIIILLVGGVIFFNRDGGAGASNTAGTGDNAPARDLLPNETLTDASGVEVDLHEVVGNKPAVVNSWATWCPFCVNELPDFVELQEALGDDIQVIAVNRAESVEKAEGFIADVNAEGITYLYDRSDSWYRTIGGFAMPETLFVNAAGEIVLHKRGPLTFQEAKQIVDQQLLTQ